MVVFLEHHHGSQRQLRPGVRSLRFRWKHLQFGGQRDGQQRTATDHKRSRSFDRGDVVGHCRHPRCHATNANTVEFELFGGIYGYSAPVLCTATATEYGWLCSWNTTTVPNGNYVLVSEASGSGGSTYSSGVSVTVNNAPPPTTSVLVPSTGATLSGTAATLDASATNATSVEFSLLGGTYGYKAHTLCTATLTYYGWVCSWNSTTVPNGSYALVSEASGAGGTAYSSGVSVTVKN